MASSNSSDKLQNFVKSLKNYGLRSEHRGQVDDKSIDTFANVGTLKEQKIDDAVELTNFSQDNPEKQLNIIVKSVSTHNEAIQNVINSKDKQQIIHFDIAESIKRFDKENFEKVKEILQNQQVITFQSISDGSFSIAWKNTKDEIYAVNVIEKNIRENDLVLLSKFIVEFLSECLQQNHSGLSSSKNLPADKFNIDLTLFADKNELNLLFYAASNGNTQIIPVLLLIAFNVNMMHARYLAVDYAYEYGHFETILLLLKNNSNFPHKFNIDDCPNEDLKEFTEMSRKLHEHIKISELDEIRKILLENPNLRYFYNCLNNQSASAVAIIEKKFEVYELLLQHNLYLSIWEGIETLTKDLNWEEKTEIHEIHFRNKKYIQEPHLITLLSKCSVVHDDERVQERLNHVMRAFQELNNFPFIQILLKIAALLPNLQIVFDFNRSSVNYLDPTQSRWTTGLFYMNGRVYVGAKQLLSLIAEHEVFATIAHELCHFVLFAIFGNEARPYKDGDIETENEFEDVSWECEGKRRIDPIIDAVYEYYPEDMHHAELIVRIPHFLAHYCKEPQIIERLKIDFKALFDFFETDLVPKLEKVKDELIIRAEKQREEFTELKAQVPILENKMIELEANRKAKNKKIFILIIALVLSTIILTSVGGLITFWVYEPSYNWTKLSQEQKEQVFNGIVKFEGVDLKFCELYGKNETNNGVFSKLLSHHIKLFMKNKVLDLNETQYHPLQNEIILEYKTLNKNLRNKVDNAVIDFQGQSVRIDKLLRNDTERILNGFNSDQIIELVKNQSTIKISHEIENVAKFYVERRFVDKYNETREMEKSVANLIEKSLNEKIILLSDNAGTGKTTTFKNIALKLKKKFPLKCIQYMDLKTKIEIYQKYNNSINTVEVLEILKEVFELHNLDYEVFVKLYNSQNVLILWDGFDEISPKYTDFMLTLIQLIKHSSQNVQFISTRPHYEKIIQEKYYCSSFKLSPYSKEDNDEFLKMFYAHKKLNSSQIEKVNTNVQKNIKIIEKNELKNHVDSPLMLKMIAEVSYKDDDTLDGTNLYTIYESFVILQINYTRYKGDIVQKEEVEAIARGQKLTEIFQYFAVNDTSYCDKKLKIIQDNENKTFDKNKLSRYGILTFNSENKADFIHRTFSEFFLAQYIVENVYSSNGESFCKEIERRFLFFKKTLYISPQVKLFLSQYLKTNRFQGIDKNLMACFETNLNYLIFREVYRESYDPLYFLSTFLHHFPFTNDSLEILWHLNENTTFFSWLAISEPVGFIKNYKKLAKIIFKYFPNQGKSFFGKHQRGNFLYGAYRKIDKERNSEQLKIFHEQEFHKENKLKISKYLDLLNVSIHFNPNEIRSIESVSKFYQFIKPHVTVGEYRESLKTNFVDILNQDGSAMWNEFEMTFSHEEIQKMIYKGTKEGISTIYYVHNFATIKLIFSALKDTENSRFMNLLLYDNNLLLLEKTLIMVDDNFEIVWHEINSRFSVQEKRTILKTFLIDDGNSFDYFYLFDAAIEFGTVEKFERVKNIYLKYFNSTEMQKFCVKYFRTFDHYSNLPNIETARSLIKYLKSLFTFEKMKNVFKDPLIKFYELFNEDKNVDSSYPFIILLKEIITPEEFANIK